MSNRDDQILLADIMVAIEKIQRYTAGYDKDRFLGDERTIDAVVRNLEIIGEAVRQVSDTFKQNHLKIPCVVFRIPGSIPISSNVQR